MTTKGVALTPVTDRGLAHLAVHGRTPHHWGREAASLPTEGVS